MADEFSLDLGKFYTEDAVSEEPAGGTTTGLQSLRSKLAGWLAGLRSAQWKAKQRLRCGQGDLHRVGSGHRHEGRPHREAEGGRRSRGARRQDLRRAVLLRPARPDAAAAARAAGARAARAATAADPARSATTTTTTRARASTRWICRARGSAAERHPAVTHDHLSGDHVGAADHGEDRGRDVLGLGRRGRAGRAARRRSSRRRSCRPSLASASGR